MSSIYPYNTFGLFALPILQDDKLKTKLLKEIRTEVKEELQDIRDEIKELRKEIMSMKHDFSVILAELLKNEKHTNLTNEWNIIEHEHQALETI